MTGGKRPCRAGVMLLSFPAPIPEPCPGHWPPNIMNSRRRHDNGPLSASVFP